MAELDLKLSGREDLRDLETTAWRSLVACPSSLARGGARRDPPAAEVHDNPPRKISYYHLN
jgi:hypothetical protein